MTSRLRPFSGCCKRKTSWDSNRILLCCNQNIFLKRFEVVHACRYHRFERLRLVGAWTVKFSSLCTSGTGHEQLFISLLHLMLRCWFLFYLIIFYLIYVFWVQLMMSWWRSFWCSLKTVCTDSRTSWLRGKTSVRFRAWSLSAVWLRCTSFFATDGVGLFTDI